MGLDVNFRLKPALDAGLRTRVVVEDYDNEQMIITLLKVPGYAHWSAAYMAVDDGIAMATVRANKWGSTYDPLTKFLAKHDIEWGEY